MNNLMEGIGQFKIKRQIARQCPQERDEIEDLVKIYEAITHGQDGIKQEFSERWDKLPEDKRAELVDRLLKMGLLSHKIGYALEIFNGKVVSLV